MNISLTEFTRLIETARNLTEPGEPNHEYIRGQVNLITDYAGLPGETDNYYPLLTAVIAHEISVAEFMYKAGSIVIEQLHSQL